MKWKKFLTPDWNEENCNIWWNGLATPMTTTLGNPNPTSTIQGKQSTISISQIPLPHTNYMQTFSKAWYLNCLKTYAILSTSFLAWKSKSKKGIVLWINFSIFNFQSYLIRSSYLISDHSGVWLYVQYYKVQEHTWYTHSMHGQCMHHHTLWCNTAHICI